MPLEVDFLPLGCELLRKTKCLNFTFPVGLLPVPGFLTGRAIRDFAPVSEPEHCRSDRSSVPSPVRTVYMSSSKTFLMVGVNYQSARSLSFQGECDAVQFF